jgi:hypothetical protein
MAKRLPPDAQDVLQDFFADILFSLMTGMIKADSVEADFAQIKEAAKKLTKVQMQQIASLAGKYYAEHVPNKSRNLTPDKVAALKKDALEFALKQPPDGNE